LFFFFLVAFFFLFTLGNFFGWEVLYHYLPGPAKTRPMPFHVRGVIQLVQLGMKVSAQ